jgi:FlaA1/EpsC-like NDP-sugar epimerase
MTNWLRIRLLSRGCKGRVPAPATPPAPAVRVPITTEVDVTDLLNRPPVNLDTPELQRFLAGKTVLVTGAGGSIGSEICRQIMRFCPAALVLLEQAENNLFEIDRELRETWLGATIHPCVADICDERRVRNIFAAHTPQVVLHCAAHKHVPMMELNPGEAIKNNVFGTKCVADAAAEFGAHAFVMVSTDKAVNPTSVMGAAKRFAELYVQSKNFVGSASADGIAVAQSFSDVRKIPSAEADPTCCTRFVAVRFGNVLGSSGSVVPVFKKQIAAGGPLTVTHPDMRRYFMTISEASQLVLQAGAIGRGGEIFVLDMGQAIRIVDLAREMIERSGLRVGEDIAIEFTGIRRGEKLHEELAGHAEQTCATSHPKIRVWQLPAADARQVESGLRILWQAVDGAREEAIAALARCVPEYRPDGCEIAFDKTLGIPASAFRLPEEVIAAPEIAAEAA